MNSYPADHPVAQAVTEAASLLIGETHRPYWKLEHSWMSGRILLVQAADADFRTDVVTTPITGDLSEAQVKPMKEAITAELVRTGTRPIPAQPPGGSQMAVATAAVRDRLSLLHHMAVPERGAAMMLELMALPREMATWEWMAAAAGSPSERYRNAETLSRYTLDAMVESELFVATGELCELLSTAAPQYPAERLFVSDILAPYGTVWFETPIPDAQGGAPIRMMSWTVAQPGDHLFALMGPERTGDKPILTLFAFADTREVVADPGEAFPRVYPMTSVLWEIDAEAGGVLHPPGDEEARVMAETLRSSYARLIMSYWAVMRERLTESAPPPAPVLPKKVKLARRRHPRLNSAVHVVRLQRAHHGGGSGEGPGVQVDWRNRWVVRTHWRNQWYPSTQEHKPKLIMSYLKGPEDLPLIGGERAFLPPAPRR